MHTEVLIRLTMDGKWRLRIVAGDNCLLSVPHDTVDAALNTARCLRLHVDNACELPIRQYPGQEGTGLSFNDLEKHFGEKHAA